MLLVGINPGIRSSQVGHHFAGPSNRFWKLLYDSRLVTEPIGFADDDRLPEWGIGLTNLIPRPTPGIDTLRPEEYGAGAKVLRRKIRRVKPEVVAFVGVTLFPEGDFEFDDGLAMPRIAADRILGDTRAAMIEGPSREAIELVEIK